LKKLAPHIGAVEFAKKYNISLSLVKSKIRQLKLYLLPHGERLCRICLKDLAIIGRNHCKLCYNRLHREWENQKIKKDSVRYRLYNIYYTVKKRDNIKLDFDWKYLLELYHLQNGKCYYTGRKMIATDHIGSKRNDDCVSVDRKDPSKPYTKKNIVLCTFWANNAKRRLSVEDFFNYAASIVKTHKQLLKNNKKNENV